MNYVDITTDQLMCFHTKKTKHYLVTLGFQKVITTKTWTRFFFSRNMYKYIGVSKANQYLDHSPRQTGPQIYY